jgi:hypothetical protein
MTPLASYRTQLIEIALLISSPAQDVPNGDVCLLLTSRSDERFSDTKTYSALRNGERAFDDAVRVDLNRRLLDQSIKDLSIRPDTPSASDDLDVVR